MRNINQSKGHSQVYPNIECEDSDIKNDVYCLLSLCYLSIIMLSENYGYSRLKFNED